MTQPSLLPPPEVLHREGLTFVVPGIPVGKGRHREQLIVPKGGGRPFIHRHPDEKTLRFEERVRNCARAAGVRIANDGALELLVVAYWPMTGTPLKRGTRPGRAKTSRPDADNVAKAVADALNGVAWKDDAQVARLVVEKRHCAQDDAEGARVVVTIKPLDEAAGG